MLGRISAVEEYRGAVVFLLGEGASFVTGAVSVELSLGRADDG